MDSAERSRGDDNETLIKMKKFTLSALVQSLVAVVFLKKK